MRTKCALVQKKKICLKKSLSFVKVIQSNYERWRNRILIQWSIKFTLHRDPVWLTFIHSGVFHVDYNECESSEDYPEEIGICGDNAKCMNTIGSFYCKCLDGFLSSLNSVDFPAVSSAVCYGRWGCINITSAVKNTKVLSLTLFFFIKISTSVRRAQDCVDIMQSALTRSQAILASVMMVLFPPPEWKIFIRATVWRARVRCPSALLVTIERWLCGGNTDNSVIASCAYEAKSSSF